MMRNIAYTLISAILSVFAAVFFAFGEDSSKVILNSGVSKNINKVVVIPVSGTVDYGMAAFIGRNIREVADTDKTLVVLDIDTFGGQLDAAFSIVDSVTACKAPTVAFVRSKAISAGALIAFAANKIVMRPGTTIGDVAPLINTGDGPKMLGEKHQSPIRAKFRTLADKNGYPEILSEAMVTEELAVFEIVLPDTVIYLDSVKLADLDPQIKSGIKSTKSVVRSGELLTMTESEALRYGFSKMTVSTIDEMLRSMGYANAEVVTVGKNWSEKLVGAIAILAPLLMMIGFSALYIEMRSPGFGFIGITGVICLAIVFFGQYMVGLADYTELILLIAGATLLAVEILVIPGFGIAGIAGILLMITGMVLSFQNFVIPNPELPWQLSTLKVNLIRISLSILGSIALIFVFFRYFFESMSRVIKGPYLSETLKDALSDAGMAFVPKIGDIGIASTSLRPAGKVRIDKNICDVVTDGQFIDDGTTVVVVQIHGNRIVVATV